MERFVFRAILHPAEEGGFWVDVPALDGCITEGDNYQEAICMVADAMKTYIASLMKNNEEIPSYERSECPEGCLFSDVSFETDESYVIDGSVISAAQAARELDVSAGRVTHMIDAGILEGYRRGRRTWVSKDSVAVRKANTPKAGRPKTERKIALT